MTWSLAHTKHCYKIQIRNNQPVISTVGMYFIISIKTVWCSVCLYVYYKNNEILTNIQLEKLFFLPSHRRHAHHHRVYLGHKVHFIWLGKTKSNNFSRKHTRRDASGRRRDQALSYWAKEGERQGGTESVREMRDREVGGEEGRKGWGCGGEGGKKRRRNI